MTAIDRGRSLFQRLSPAAMNQFEERVDGQVPEWTMSDACIGAANVPRREWLAALWTEHQWLSVRAELHDLLVKKARRIARRERWPTVEGRDLPYEFAGYAMAESMPCHAAAKYRHDAVRAAAHGFKTAMWQRSGWGARYEAIHTTLHEWANNCLYRIGSRSYDSEGA